MSEKNDIMRFSGALKDKDFAGNEQCSEKISRKAPGAKPQSRCEKQHKTPNSQKRTYPASCTAHAKSDPQKCSVNNKYRL